MAVNESNTIQYTVTTSRVTDGTTLYWKTTGNTINSDIVGGNTGSIIITNNRALLNVTISADADTDGPKTLGITILTGSLSGTPVVNTASTILINDTSLSPVARLYLMGALTYGSSGLNVSSAYKSSPTQVGSDTDWNQISNGNGTKMAIKTNGTLWSWGGNSGGPLGLNTGPDKVSSPTQVGAGTTWSKISVAEEVAMAIKTDGTLWTWGFAQNGQSGDGNSVAVRSSPVQIGALTNWSSVVLAGKTPTAIKTNGTLWTWGNPAYGQLGYGGTVFDQVSPTQVGAETTWSKVFGGSFTTAAIKTDGTLWLWGDGSYGGLGFDNTQSKSSPVQLGTDTNWSQAAFGRNACVAIKTDGTLWTWGRNITGQLGNNSTNYITGNKSSPTQVGTGTTWFKITGGYQFILATKTDGTLWGWGRNAQGVLGKNTTDDYSSPVQIGTNTNWDKISCFNRRGAAQFPQHAMLTTQ
jgi:alpha-tubulin suppressor-like RCC1 family protein